MSPERPAQRRSPPLTQQDLAEGFSRLVAGQWRVREALPFTHLTQAAPSLAAPFLLGRLVDGDDREREVAAALLAQLQGPRVVAPLRGLLQDAALPDAVRASAAAVLHDLGEPLREPGLAAALRDPLGLLDTITEAILHRARSSESFREQVVASIEEDRPEGRAEVLHVLAATRDPRALLLLTPVLFSKRVATVLAAVNALEALASLDAVPLLEERARGDPSPRVRARARAAHGRLLMRANPLWEDLRPIAGLTDTGPVLPLHRACLTLVDQHGDQAVHVSRRRPDGFLKVVTVLVSDTGGVKSCYGVDMMRDSELDEMLAGLAQHGLTPVEVGLGHCLAALEEARRLSVASRRRLPVELEIWKGLLAPGAAQEPEQLPLAEDEGVDLDQSLPRTGALLATPEFRQWYFEASLVWPYVDEWCAASIEEQQGERGRQTLETLVTLAARDLVDQRYRELLRGRLARQAWLLARLGKADAAGLAAAASRGLDPRPGQRVERHPFVRAMVLSSFLNAGLRPPAPPVIPGPP